MAIAEQLSAWHIEGVAALTVIVLLIAVISAAAVNAEVQRRLLAQGGSWFPSTIKSGLCGLRR